MLRKSWLINRGEGGGNWDFKPIINRIIPTSITNTCYTKEMKCYEELTARQWWRMPLTAALGRQRQVDLILHDVLPKQWNQPSIGWTLWNHEPTYPFSLSCFSEYSSELRKGNLIQHLDQHRSQTSSYWGPAKCCTEHLHLYRAEGEWETEVTQQSWVHRGAVASIRDDLHGGIHGRRAII